MTIGKTGRNFSYMQLEVGKILEGKVTGITKFGVFVDLGEGKTGMVHISEVASTYVKEIRDFVNDGDTVKVKILNISEDGKIGLSMKQAKPPEPPTSRPQGSFHRDRQPFHRDRNQQSYPPASKMESFEWKGKNGRGQSGNASFEDMMNKFKQTSDEKMSDLKRVIDTRRGSANRRGNGNNGGNGGYSR